MSLDKLLKNLKLRKGISNVRVLTKLEKKLILELEESSNIGVRAALDKKHTITLTKTQFKASKLTLQKDKETIFPPLRIPEIDLEESVSALPGKKVHKELEKDLEFETDDVSVLVGIDEISDAIDDASQTDKKDRPEQNDEEIQALYSQNPTVTIDYANLFSYLDTRPTEIQYEYHTETDDEVEQDIRSFEFLDRINRVRKMEKTVYSMDTSNFIPEGFTGNQLEQFNLYRKLSFGAEMNKIQYELTFN